MLSKFPGVKDSCVIGIEEAGDVRVHAVLLMTKDKEWDDPLVRPIVEEANKRLQPQPKMPRSC